MGYTIGLLSGLTLTTTTLWLTLLSHRLNRSTQRTSLHQQTLILHSIVDPPTPYDDIEPRRLAARIARGTRYARGSDASPQSEEALRAAGVGGQSAEELYRRDADTRLLLEAERKGLVEQAKEGWNAEVERAVRGVNETDWRGVRERWEERVSALWVRFVGDGARERGPKGVVEDVAGKR